MRQIPGYELWLGHAGDVRDLHGVLSTGIVAIIDLAMDEPPAAVTRDLAYCRFPLIDSPGNPGWLLRVAIDTLAYLLRSRIPVLVYCANGLSRSPCIAAAAIACVSGASVTDVLELVAQSGAADISPGLWAEVCAV